MKSKAPLSFLAKRRNLGLLVMRVGLGAMFLTHGLPKVMGGPEAWAKYGHAMSAFGIDFAPAFWGLMAGLSESCGGLCLILGLVVRPAAIFLISTMFVAASSHLLLRGQSLGQAAHAIEDLFAFVGLLFVGPGRYSLDHRLFGGEELDDA